MSLVLQPRPDVGRPRPWDVPTWDRIDTPDGLTVWACHLAGQPRITVRVLVDAPSTVEPLDRAGLGEIVAHTLDEGSERHDAAGFAAALDLAGANFSADAGIGGTGVGITVPAWRLTAGLDLLAEAIALPSFPEVEVDRLVRQTLDQIRREEATPEGRARRAFRARVVAADHRASMVGNGSPETVARITRDDVVGFHRDRYRRGAATVVIAGDLDGIDVAGELDRALAGWEDGSADQRSRAVPVTGPGGRRTVVIDLPGAVQTQLMAGRVGPDRRAPDWAALRVAAYVLGGTLTSRLDTVLREEKGYTYGMRSGVTSLRAGGLVTLASGSVQTEVTGAAATDLLEIVAGLAADGPTPAEVRTAIDAVVEVQPLRLETVRAVVGRAVGDLAEDLPVGHLATALADLRAVTTEAAAAAAATHLGLDDVLLLAVGDAATIAEPLRALGHGSFEVVEAGSDG